MAERSFPCKLEAVTERQTKKIVDIEIEKHSRKSGFLGLKATTVVTRSEERIVSTDYYGKFTITPEMIAYEQEIIQLLTSQLSPIYDSTIFSNKADAAIYIKSPKFKNIPIGTEMHLGVSIMEKVDSSGKYE